MNRREHIRNKEGQKLRRLLRNTTIKLRDFDRKYKEPIQWIYGSPMPIQTRVELKRVDE